MIIIYLILIFLLGLVFGSFINALEYRIENKKSINGRSFCPHCNHQLGWLDLFPIFSFLFLKGKCRYCQKLISWQYPLVELITAMSFVGVFWKFGVPATIPQGLSLLITLVIVFVAILVGLHDAKTTYILSAWVYIGIVAAILLISLNYHGIIALLPVINYLTPFILSALVPGLFFFALYFFSKGKWMGEGEYELAALIGFTLGFPLIIPAYYFAFIVGSVVGLILVYVSKNKQMNSAIPFGPFLMSGLIFSLIFGQQIVELYARMFLG